MSESRQESSMQPGGTFKYALLLFLLVASIVAMALVFMGLQFQDRNSSAHIQLASELQLLSRSVVSQALAASRGEAPAFTDLEQTRDRFDRMLDAQKNGREEMSAAPPAVMPQVNALDAQWQQVRGDVNVILQGREAVMAVSGLVPLLEDSMPPLLALSDQIAERMGSVNPRQVYIATRQLLLGQRIQNNLNRLLAAGENASAAMDRFQQDVALFGNVVDGFENGNAQFGVERVTDPQLAARVAELKALYDPIEAEVRRTLDNAPRLFQVRTATDSLVNQSDELQAAAGALLSTYTNLATTGWAPLPETLPGLRLGFTVVYLLGALALIALFILVLTWRRESQRRLDESEQRKRETEEQNRRNQEAILRLLDEMGDLAEGDLTVQASVTEDITGAIADSVNYAIEALRDLVTTINNTSERLASAAQETRSVADSLAKSSEAQARQIDSASKTVTQMAEMMDEVSAKTASSSEVAEKSVGIAHQGGDRVRRTIQGMDAIREHIQETSKRIKRLGESSQEIGDIVALINDIADQTNILALNAAIQASSAGEAGRGFAVVADEVQRLAERAGNATKRIEALVKTIQADTNEAIISMEKSTSEVVNGAGLAEKAGESLEEIEAVSGRLAELISEISRAARRVSEMGSQVSAAMVSINEITGQTAQTSVVTASSINQLNQLAQEMQQSVAGFRLPEHA